MGRCCYLEHRVVCSDAEVCLVVVFGSNEVCCSTTERMENTSRGLPSERLPGSTSGMAGRGECARTRKRACPECTKLLRFLCETKRYTGTHRTDTRGSTREMCEPCSICEEGLTSTPPLVIFRQLVTHTRLFLQAPVVCGCVDVVSLVVSCSDEVWCRTSDHVQHLHVQSRSCSAEYRRPTSCLNCNDRAGDAAHRVGRV